MDAIFKKSTGVFNVVSVAAKEPYHYDRHGNLKPEYLEEAVRRRSSAIPEEAGVMGQKKPRGSLNGVEGREKAESGSSGS